MKICFTCSEYPPYPHGGIGVFIKNLAEQLVKNGHSVYIIGLYDIDSDLNEIINGVRVIRLKRNKSVFFPIFNFIKFRRFIKNLISKNKIDLIEDNDWDSYALSMIGIKCKLIYRLHNPDFYNLAYVKKIDLLSKIKIKISSNKSNLIVPVSKFIGDLFNKQYGHKHKTKIMYNSVIPSNEFPKFCDRNKNEVIYVGTLVKKKGIIELIYAWEKVLNIFPDATLKICGKDGVYNNELTITEWMKIKLGKKINSVKIVGHVSNQKINEFYKKASLFISPSHNEAFSLVVLESMGNGCPTIYSNSTSGPEFIIDSENGILINPKNIDEISSSIIKILKDRDLAEKISFNGYNTIIEKFSINKIYQMNEKMFNKIINE